MKILFFQWNAFMQKGVESALRKLDIEYEIFFYQFVDWEQDDKFKCLLEDRLENTKYDLVFSIDYAPLVSTICNVRNMRYIAWVYDSPIHIRDKSTLYNKCNRIYFFDKGQVEKYRLLGINTAYYMPLAVDSSIFLPDEYSRGNIVNDNVNVKNEISFVGQLYQSDFSYLCLPLNDYQKGFLEGIVRAQQMVYGGYFISDVLSDEIIFELNIVYKMVSKEKFQIQKEELEYAMACEVTGRERFMALELLSKRHCVDLYSKDKNPRLSQVNFKGYVDYYKQMPYVFRNSKINLNISLKTIRTGIPLRVLDILGCGGFLITNYQQEIVEYFEPGVDLVIYENMEDLVVKVDYYLKHENERMQIAKNGFYKVKKLFAFEDKIKKMFGGNVGEE